MPNISRHRSDSLIPNGTGTSSAMRNIRDAVRQGSLSFSVVILKENQRLDHVAFSAYGDSRLWWVIAAASGIGWWLQVPPGTRLRVPTDISRIEELV